MSSVDSITNLNDCECCEGVAKETPAALLNRPGLSAIAYRVGTQAQFKETMLARLSGISAPALSGLTTRDDTDFSIALLDAWATVSDVLAFYQERIANEAYLRSATERLSVLELARLIDYQLRPGVAASTYLAFTVEDAQGTLGQAFSIGTTAQTSTEPPPPIAINAGVKVQSVPGPGELPQTFETVEDIQARPEWNAARPRLTQKQNIPTNLTFAILAGTATNLKPGDRLLIVEGGSKKVAMIVRLTIDDKANTTRVDFALPPANLPAYIRPTGLAEGQITDFAPNTPLNEATVNQIIQRKWSEENLSALAEVQGWPVGELITNINKQTARREYPAGSGVFAFRQRAALFGHNAPDWKSLPIALRIGEVDPTPITKLEALESNSVKFAMNIVEASPDEFQLSPSLNEASRFKPGIYANRENSWADHHFPANTTTLFLDAVYSQIVPGSWIVLSSVTDTEIFKVKSVAEESHSDFNLTLKVTRLEIEGGHIEKFSPRNATVYAQSELLALADLPIEDLIQGNTLTLDGAYLGLKTGRTVILTGERSDLKGVISSEVATLKNVIVEKGFTVITLDQSLSYSYIRGTVTINANVALATHGETVQEILGGGDARTAFQRFILKQPPLTYVSASTPSGAQSTLEVRVNDVLWHEVRSFFDHGAEERIYVTRLDDNGNTTVIFGDGKTGARLPTGQDNVRAKYRKGIGLGGIIKKDQLTQLATRPFGVKGATNPTPATGAADRERLDDARRNAPLTVLTLDRIVSLKDYEDFARAFSGIDKALATWTWFGEKRGVFVTVAGSNGAEVEEDTQLYRNLVDAMRKAGDPNALLQLKSYQPRLFRFAASLTIDPELVADKVVAAVEQKLRTSFSFAARDFGQPVHLSQLVGLVQNVHGVISVNTTEFHRADQPMDVLPRIPAAVPRTGGDEVFPAELLTLDPRPLALEVVK